MDTQIPVVGTSTKSRFWVTSDTMKTQKGNFVVRCSTFGRQKQFGVLYKHVYFCGRGLETNNTKAANLTFSLLSYTYRDPAEQTLVAVHVPRQASILQPSGLQKFWSQMRFQLRHRGLLKFAWRENENWKNDYGLQQNPDFGTSTWQGSMYSKQEIRILKWYLIRLKAKKATLYSENPNLIFF